MFLHVPSPHLGTGVEMLEDGCKVECKVNEMQRQREEDEGLKLS